jgi:hypothetical protein
MTISAQRGDNSERVVLNTPSSFGGKDSARLTIRFGLSALGFRTGLDFDSYRIVRLHPASVMGLVKEMHLMNARLGRRRRWRE